MPSFDGDGCRICKKSIANRCGETGRSRKGGSEWLEGPGGGGGGEH